MHKKPTEQHPGIEAPAVPPSIVQPILDDFKKSHPPTGTALPAEGAPPVGPIHPPEPAELDQDPGGGYNPDHTIPQP